MLSRTSAASAARCRFRWPWLLVAAQVAGSTKLRARQSVDTESLGLLAAKRWRWLNFALCSIYPQKLSASVYRTLAVRRERRRVSMATGVTLPRRLALGRVKRQPTQKRDPDVTVDGSVLLLYVFAILTSLFFVTKFALGL